MGFKSLYDYFVARAELGVDTVHEEVAPDKPRATRRTFSDVYPREIWLDLLVEDNPKRRNTQAFDRYELYRKVTNVGEALDLGITYRDIDRDYAAGNIALGLLPE